MFQATLDIVDSIPVFTLKGSLDSYGASVFEREISLLGRDVSDLIIDFSEIGYLSSLGIRSLFTVICENNA
jgi:anti-anti-sigma regulatory factor